MSEVVLLRCDRCSLLSEDSSPIGWVRDDYDSDLCPECQDLAERIESEVAKPEDLEAFAQSVDDSATKAIEAAKELGLTKPPEIHMPSFPPARKLTDQERKEIKSHVKRLEKDLKKDLKDRGVDKQTVKETLALFREQAALLVSK